ncbi:MAG: trypsin-like serine protease [Proteobacteria bacterium]|nr:trypsin-like serine protease [Pseudomonadota bacterium]
MRLLPACLALLAFATASFAEEAPIDLPGIKGQDDRVIVESLEWPWSAVVKVNRRTGGFCTGVLVAPDKVLTAAHCLWLSRTDHWLTPDVLHVVVNYRRGDWTDDAPVLSYVMGPDPALPRAGDNAALALDWAVLTLAKPLGAPIPLAAPGTDTAGPGEAMMQAGFSQDARHVPTMNRDCRNIGPVRGGRLFLHDCDAVNGDSGSPLMIAAPDGNVRLVGIHSATVNQGGTMLGLAVSAETLRAALEP